MLVFTVLAFLREKVVESIYEATNLQRCCSCVAQELNPNGQRFGEKKYGRNTIGDLSSVTIDKNCEAVLV